MSQGMSAHFLPHYTQPWWSRGWRIGWNWGTERHGILINREIPCLGFAMATQSQGNLDGLVSTILGGFLWTFLVTLLNQGEKLRQAWAFSIPPSQLTAPHWVHQAQPQHLWCLGSHSDLVSTSPLKFQFSFLPGKDRLAWFGRVWFHLNKSQSFDSSKSVVFWKLMETNELSKWWRWWGRHYWCLVRVGVGPRMVSPVQWKFTISPAQLSHSHSGKKCIDDHPRLEDILFKKIPAPFYV